MVLRNQQPIQVWATLFPAINNLKSIVRARSEWVIETETKPLIASQLATNDTSRLVQLERLIGWKVITEARGV